MENDIFKIESKSREQTELFRVCLFIGHLVGHESKVPRSPVGFCSGVYSTCNHVLDALQLNRRDFNLAHDSIEYPTHRYILRELDIQDESNGLHVIATFLNGILIHFTRRIMYDLRATYDVSQLQCSREKVSQYIESYGLDHMVLDDQ
jgi:hypothetical protein